MESRSRAFNSLFVIPHPPKARLGGCLSFMRRKIALNTLHAILYSLHRCVHASAATAITTTALPIPLPDQLLLRPLLRLLLLLLLLLLRQLPLLMPLPLLR